MKCQTTWTPTGSDYSSWLLTFRKWGPVALTETNVNCERQWGHDIKQPKNYSQGDQSVAYLFLFSGYYQLESIINLNY